MQDCPMKQHNLGPSPLLTSRLAYGCMRLPGTWNPADIGPAQRARAYAALHAAFDAGYTLFDHADIYCRGACEQLFGDFLRDHPGLPRERYQLASKCGIRFNDDPPGAPHRYDFSRAHIEWSCEQSLKRLGVEQLDLYQLHRPDLLMNPREVADAFASLKDSGKVRLFGVSNFSPAFVDTLQSALPDPLVVNQVELSLGRLNAFTDGTLDQCLRQRMTPLAWGPLGGGWLGAGGRVNDQHPQRENHIRTQGLLDEIARHHGVSRTVVALAWLLKHPAGILPIVGSCTPDHIRDAVRATQLEISRDDWYRLLVAARGERLP
jgi:predicted oxidoreductase